MPMFRKKPVVIEAVQWFKDGDHPEVEPRPAMIIFDRAENYFYVSRFDQPMIARGWLALDPEGDIAEKNGGYLPFAFYSVKSGKQAPVADHPDLLARYAAHERWDTTPVDMGYVKTLEGGHIVTPGDWIIKGVKGEFYPCKPDIFAATYEPADEVDDA
jgi:hypothetical protein